MQAPRSRTLLRDCAPAFLIAVFAGAIWIALRSGGPVKGEAFFRWLCLLLLGVTVGVIGHTAFASTGKRAIIGLVALCIASILLSGVAGLVGGYVGVSEVGAIAGVFITWLPFCSAMAGCLRGLGATAANAVALFVAVLLMALPVAGIPVVRAAASWGREGTAVSPWQGRVIEIIREGCPFFGLVDAVRPALKIDWSHLPRMYAWSGLGQDMPMLLPNVWVSAGVYAGVAGMVLGVSLIWRRRAGEASAAKGDR